MGQMYDNQDSEVTVVEQGEMKIQTQDIAVPVNGFNISTFAVPAGKKWNIKASEHGSSGLNASVADTFTSIALGADRINIVTVSGTSKLIWLSTTNLTLSEGEEIRLYTQISSYVSGTIKHSILYMESDI